jgi:hypothetical protein
MEWDKVARNRNQQLELVFNPGMEYVKRMNWPKKPLLFGLGGLLLGTAARGDVKPPGDNAYHVVVERNPFGLSPPKTNAAVTNILPPVKVDIKFTGITSDSSGKKAWLVVPPPPNNRTANQQYLTMREQETQGDIQVLEIDDKENTVKIVNAGTTTVLTFKDNGFTTPTAAAMPGNPLLQRGVPGQLPVPGTLPIPGSLPAPGIVPAPTAPGIKTAGVAPTGIPANDALAARYGLQNATPGNMTTIAPVRTIPTRNVRTPSMAPQAQTQEASVDPVVQRLMMEAQAEEARRRGENFPPLPPLPGGAGR